MTRPECSPDLLIVTFIDQFADAGEWEGTIRLKWILHRELSIQMDADEIVLRATREKNKTL